MKALAKNKETGEAQEIDIIASIRGGIPRVIVDIHKPVGLFTKTATNKNE